MRGEYKTPGGKLIAVEFEIECGHLRNVAVTGDFFLYPEESLARLASALEGQPATLNVNEFADLIQNVLDDDVELLGSSATGLATATLRALGAHASKDRDA